MNYKDNRDKLNKIANTWGSTGNMEMDFMRNKIDEISKRPEEVAKSEALAEHFSDPKTYRDWLHDSNAWFGRTVSKVPGAIPNALGGIYDLGTGLLDLGINGATYGFNKLKGTPNKWQYKDYTRPNAENNWGYNIGNRLNKYIGQPINSLNSPGRAVDWLTIAPDKRKNWSYFSVPEYSDALQKADPFNVMGMLEDAAAEAVASAGVTKATGNLLTDIAETKNAKKWYAKQDQAIRNHLENKRQAYMQPVRDEIKKSITPSDHKKIIEEIREHIYHKYKGDRSFIDAWFAKRKANQAVKGLYNKDKLIDYMIEHPWDYKTNSTLLNQIDTLSRNYNTPDVVSLYKEYQNYPMPAQVSKLKNILPEFGSEPLFKGGWIGDSRIKDTKQWFDKLLGNKGRYPGTEDRLWFSSLPEVSLGYGGDLAIMEVPDSLRGTVNKLKTPHIGSTQKAEDLLNGVVDKSTLKQVHGGSAIGQSPDYEAALPKPIVDEMLNGGKSKIYSQVRPTNLDDALRVPRKVTDPIPDDILNIPLLDYEDLLKYYRLQNMYLGNGASLPYSKAAKPVRRPKVFNFKPYPGPSKWLGNMYYNKAGQIAATLPFITNTATQIPDYLRRKDN